MVESGPILLVDDNVDANEAVALLLKLHGYRVCTAFNGHDALRQLHTGFEPSVIVLDLSMPGMDGDEFLWALGNDPQLARFPVIIHSDDPPRRVAAPVIGHVPKGRDPNRLMDLVSAACPLPASF